MIALVAILCLAAGAGLGYVAAVRQLQGSLLRLDTRIAHLARAVRAGGDDETGDLLHAINERVCRLVHLAEEERLSK